MKNNRQTEDKRNRILYIVCNVEPCWALTLLSLPDLIQSVCFFKSICKGIGIAGGQPVLEPCLIKSLRRDSVWFNEMVLRRNQNQHCMKCVCPAVASDQNLYCGTHRLPTPPAWPTSPSTCLTLVFSPLSVAILLAFRVSSQNYCSCPLAGLWGPPWPSLSFHFTPTVGRVIATKLSEFVSPPLRNAWPLPSSSPISAANSYPLLGPQVSLWPATRCHSANVRMLCSKTSSPQDVPSFLLCLILLKLLSERLERLLQCILYCIDFVRKYTLSAYSIAFSTH